MSAAQCSADEVLEIDASPNEPTYWLQRMWGRSARNLRPRNRGLRSISGFKLRERRPRSLSTLRHISSCRVLANLLHLVRASAADIGPVLGQAGAAERWKPEESLQE